MNTPLTPATEHDIHHHDTPTCRECCAAVRNMDNDLLPYAYSDLPSVRVLLALLAGTPLTVLRVLATDAHPAVRKALRGNSSTRREHDILHALDAADEADEAGEPVRVSGG